MNHLEAAREAERTAWAYRNEGTIEFSDLFQDVYTPEELARLWLVVDEWRKTVDMVARLVGRAWVDTWESHGAVEVDGYLVTAKKGYTKEECIDPDGFHDWLVLQTQESPGLIRKILNPNQIRKAQLPPAARDTWFEKTRVVQPDAVLQPEAIPTEFLNDRD